MRNLLLLILLASFVGTSALAGEEASVEITSPLDGAKLDAKAQNKLDYSAVVGPKGDHVHVYVDGKQVAVLREKKGSYPLESLAPGPREICVKIVTKNHVPIGVDRCVKVTVA